MIDIVNGIVLGPVTYRAELIQPSGNIYGSPRQFGSYSDALIWAQDTVADARAQIGPEECKRLGYDKMWELRFWG